MYSLCENYKSVFVWLIKPNLKKKSIALAIDFSVKKKKKNTNSTENVFPAPVWDATA